MSGTARPHLCVATPCFGASVSMVYTSSVIRLAAALRERGVDLSFILRGGDALITRCRNSIVAEFLATPVYTHLMWIDADLGFEPESVLRLLGSGHPVAAGVYPFKEIVWPERLEAGADPARLRAGALRYVFNARPGPLTVPPDGFAEVLDVPAGFMLIQREVFAALAAAFPELRYRPDRMPGLEHLEALTADHHHRFFDGGTDEAGRYLSEGPAFCRLWQRAGGRVFADMRSRLSHQGSHVFEGDLAATLRLLATPPGAA